MEVICDTDFLSSILKIDALDLVLDFFGVSYILLPNEVIIEISQTGLIDKVFSSKSIKQARALVRFKQEGLGKGELAAINLAKAKRKAVFLSNDKRALKFARENKVKSFDLFSLLLASKRIKLLNHKDLEKIIKNLRDKDYFHFGKKREKILLD